MQEIPQFLPLHHQGLGKKDIVSSEDLVEIKLLEIHLEILLYRNHSTHHLLEQWQDLFLPNLDY